MPGGGDDNGAGAANRPEDVTGNLDRDTLIAVWPELRLPKACGRPCKRHYPQLRAASSGIV